MEASKCPKCGEEPTFVEHMEKWYCFECNTYVEEPAKHAEHVEEVHESPQAEIRSEEPGVQEKPIEDKANVLAAELSALEREEQVVVVHESPKCEVVLEHVSEEAKPAPELSQIEPQKPPVPEIKMCPTCGQPMKWIEKYKRNYCYGCRKYAPKEASETPLQAESKPEPKPAAPSKTCPACGQELKFIEKYNEWYCYKCRRYPLHVKKPAAAAPAVDKPQEIMCQKCGKPLKYIEQYQRHYCYTCKEYAPKSGSGKQSSPEVKICPVCKGELKFVSQYNEWYCYSCKKYTLRPSTPVLLLWIT